MSAILALDTSTEWASVAVYDGSAVLAEETWHAQRRHAEELFPTIERVLSHARVALSPAATGDAQIDRIDKVAVATGPGSFTGLRVAIAAAQGLARGSGAALVGVSTLDVLAYPHASSKQRTCPLLPAGRGEFYAALYQERNRKWARRSPFIVGPLVDLCRQIGTHTLFVGEIDPEAESTLRDLLGPLALFAAPASRMRRAGYLAELGWNEIADRKQQPLGSLEPIYVRQPAMGGSFAQPFAPPPMDDVSLGLPKRPS